MEVILTGHRSEHYLEMETNTVYEIREGLKFLISVCDSVNRCMSKIDNLKCILDILDEDNDTNGQSVPRDELESHAINRQLYIYPEYYWKSKKVRCPYIKSQNLMRQLQTRK